MFAQFSTKTLLRGVLFLIILGTLPFYVIGFIVLASNNATRADDENINTPTTETPLGADVTLSPTVTVSPTRNLTATLPSDLRPTPPNFIPPTRLPFSTATFPPVIIPTDTPAPTLTAVVNVDKDGDGLLDGQDNCPSDPGPPQNSGCPIPVSDSDGDGVPNATDQCPNRSGPADLNGCPPDSDGDGILDDVDQCPLQAGIPLLNGCPDPDSDGDGITNSNDTCPNQAGTAATGGCPDSDGDGVADNNDTCPNQAGDPNNGGCPLPETTQQP